MFAHFVEKCLLAVDPCQTRMYACLIIEFVDSISRDERDAP